MKDIIDSLKIRLNNPFIISFLLSWPFWNWEIVVALLWYNSDNLSKWTNFSNYYDIVNHYSTFHKSIVMPLISATAYTILYPILKWAISSFNAFFSTLEESNVLMISKRGYVSTKKYVEALRKAEEEILALSDIIKNEARVLEENNKLQTDNSTLSSTNQSLKIEIKDYEQKLERYAFLSTIGSFDGDWTLKIQGLGITYYAFISIENGKLSITRQESKEYFSFDRISGYFANVFTQKAFINMSVTESWMSNIEITPDEQLFIDDTVKFFSQTQNYDADFKNQIFVKKTPSISFEFKKVDN